MIRFSYFVRHALRGMKQAAFVNVVAILTMAIALLVAALFAGAIGQLNELIDSWKEDILITVYLEDGLEDIERVRLISSIQEKSGRTDTEVEYISREEALERLRGYLGDDADILEGLENNPLPDSLEVRGHIVESGAEILEKYASEISELEGVSEVDYGQDWVRRLDGLVSLMTLTGLFLGGIILIAAVITVSNTIKLAVFARKDEIEIMKLCGATDSFVRAPFLIEGFLQGILGAALASAGIILVWLTVLPGIERGMMDAFAMSMNIISPLNLIIWLFIGGGIAGFAGSALSLGRFLNA